MSIVSFLVYCIIVTFTPGPTNIAILSIAQNFGLKNTFQYILGAVAAFGMLLASSVILNSALMAVIPKILIIMQVIGCFYMLYLAYQVYKMDLSGDIAGQSASFMFGFLMQLLNPKVWLFTMTVIPSYVMPYYKSMSILFVFVLVVTIICSLALVTWALFGMVFKVFLHKYQRAANITLALCLVYSALEVSGIIEIFKR